MNQYLEPSRVILSPAAQPVAVDSLSTRAITRLTSPKCVVDTLFFLVLDSLALNGSRQYRKTKNATS